MGLLTISLLVATSLGGCWWRGNSEEVANEDEFISSPSELRNTETNVSIVVPEGWLKVGGDLRQSQDIYTLQPEDQLYATVLSEDKAVLSQFALEDNAEQYRQLIRDELDSYERETKTGVTSIDGHQAIQYEIRGTVEGESVVYLHTTVRGDDGYYQVVGWTTADRYRENKETLENVIESFEGT